MADEKHLNELMDIAEQAKREGDTATFKSAMADYESASAPPVVHRNTFMEDMAVGGQALKRGAMVGVKGVNDSISHLLTLIPDAGVEASNLIRGRKDQTLGQKYQQWSDSDVAPPSNLGEKAIYNATGFLAGSKVPTPGAGVRPPSSPMQVTAETARDAGYKLPPSSIPNAGKVARAAEAIVGKKTIDAAVSPGNKEQTIANVAKEFGLPEGTQITPEVIDAVQGNAWKQGYSPIESLGPQYASLVDTIRKQRENVKKLFTDYARTGRSERLDEARAASTAAENSEKVLDGALQQLGKPELYGAYKEARTTIAKASDVERNLIESTGAVKESGLAKEFGKGKPQSGAIEAAGRTAQANSKSFSTVDQPAFATLSDKFAGLGSVAGVTGTMLSHDPKYAEIGLGLLAAKMGIHAGKAGIRKALTSDTMLDQMTYLTPEQKRAAIAQALSSGAIAGQGSR